jgi:serine protease
MSRSARRQRVLVGCAAGLAAMFLFRGVGGSASGAQFAANIKQAMLAQQGREAVVSEALQTHPVLADERAGRRFVAGHVVVKFAPQVTRRVMSLIAGEVGATSVTRPSYADFCYVSIPDDEDPVAAAARLAQEPDVVYAEPDALVYPLYVPNDPYYAYQWHFQKIGMERAWDINRGASSRITVAVIDTGVAYKSAGVFVQAPDLAGTHFVPGYDFVWDDDEPLDTDAHGTHVTGTIAQTTNNGVGVAGMAFNVNIMPIKTLYVDWDVKAQAPFPYGASTTARGIRFAADNGAKVINMSLGSLAPNTSTHDALVYAVSKGVFVSISAGNEALRGNSPSWPASYARDLEGVVAVAALDYDLKRAPYSSIQDYVEIAAPGGDTTADRNGDGYADGVLQQTMDSAYVSSGVFNRFGYFFYQGTSMAAPHVSGFAALLMDQGITSPAAIEAAMKRWATDVPPAGRDNETGYGVINPRNTLRGLGLAK